MFDPYHIWLGIPPDEQPPNHYRLLGIRVLEDNDEVIAHAADQRMAHLRTFQTGPNTALSQKLLNEVAAARVCLLKPAKKAEYDAALQRVAETPDKDSSDEFRSNLQEMVAQTRRETPGARRSHKSPHVLSLIAAGVILLVVVVVVWRIAARPQQVHPVAIKTEPAKATSATGSKTSVQPKPVQTVHVPEPPAAKAEAPATPKPQPAAIPAVAKVETVAPPPKPQPAPERKPEPKPEPKPAVEPDPAPAVASQLPEKLQSLKESDKGASAAVRRQLVEQALALVREAISADEYSVAMEAAKIASADAARLRDKELVKQSRAVLQGAQQRQKAFEGVRAAKEALRVDPKNPTANAEYGKFLCVVKGDWRQGLTLLKASGSALASLAAKDLADTNKPGEQTAIADAWWDAAEALPLAERKNVLLHAAMWYYRANFHLGGNQKTLAEKRIRLAGLEPQITNKIDGSLLVLIPEGKFLSGPKKEEVYLPAYYLAMYEVTFAQYEQFIKATGHEPPTTGDGLPWRWTGKGFQPSMQGHPVGCVQWQETLDYCRWAGLRLPTATEWEKGARGTDGRTYPWGNDWDAAKCQSIGSRVAGVTCPVGAHPEGCSPWGLYNMAGNVWEWCEELPGVNRGIYCGGGCERADQSVFACWTRMLPTDRRGLQFGFRVARDFRP